VDAAYQGSCLTLEHIDNIGLHYAQTLAEWRRRFNAKEAFVRTLGFDDVFLRAWNYYMTYCASWILFADGELSHSSVFASRMQCIDPSVRNPIGNTAFGSDHNQSKRLVGPKVKSLQRLQSTY
jgi:hypothetical protein